jgi:hypothetical protein
VPFEVPPAVQQLAEKARATVRRLLAPAVELRKSEALRRAAEERQRLEELARGQAEELRLEALDQARLGRSPPVVVTVPPPPLPPAPGRSVRSLSWIPGAAGLVAGGLGTTFLLGARAKYVALIDRTVNPSVAGSYRASGPTDAAIGTALLGVGAAGVVTAALMFALGGAQGPVAFVPVPQGGVLTAALQF